MPIINSTIRKINGEIPPTPVETKWNVIGIRSKDDLPELGSVYDIYLIFDIPLYDGSYPEIPENVSLIKRVCQKKTVKIYDEDVYDNNTLTISTNLHEETDPEMFEFAFESSNPDTVVAVDVTKGFSFAKLDGEQLLCHVAIWGDNTWNILEYIEYPDTVRENLYVNSLLDFDFTYPNIVSGFSDSLRRV